MIWVRFQDGHFTGLRPISQTAGNGMFPAVWLIPGGNYCLVIRLFR